MNPLIIPILALASNAPQPMIYESYQAESSAYFDYTQSPTPYVNSSYSVSDDGINSQYMTCTPPLSSYNMTFFIKNGIPQSYGDPVTFNIEAFKAYDSDYQTLPTLEINYVRFSCNGNVYSLVTDGESTFDSSDTSHNYHNAFIDYYHEAHSSMFTFKQGSEDFPMPRQYTFIIQVHVTMPQVDFWACRMSQTFSKTPFNLSDHDRTTKVLPTEHYLGMIQSFNNYYDIAFNNGYTEGVNEGKQVADMAHPFGLLSSAFRSIGSFFSIEIFPHVTLGTIISIPIVVTLIVVLFKIFSVK